MSTSFRARLLAGELLHGIMLTLPSGAVAEVLSDAGFDWLFVDAEHGPLEAAELQTILQSVGHRTPCLVRVPACEEIPIKRALDLGAAGIIVPQVNTPDQAADAVKFSRYPPEGARAVGIARAHGYGLKFQPYVASANVDTAVIVQAESILAVENIEQICAVPGIDGIQLGPYDLSASMGLMGQIEHPAVLAAIERVTQVAQRAGLPLGMFGVAPAAVIPYVKQGYTFVTTGVDTILLGQSARAILAEMRGS